MKKIGVIISVLFLFLSTVNIGRAEEKSPIVAGLLSLVVPGLGQYYNGRPQDITKGLIIDGVFVGGIAFLVVGVSNKVNAGASSFPTLGPLNYDRGAIICGAVIIVADSIFGIVDAIVSADDINQHGTKHASTDDFGLHLSMLNDSSLHLVPMGELSLKF